MPSLVLPNIDGPVIKRQRLEDPKSFVRREASRIFAPYRTLGLVSPTDVPFTSIPLGKTTFQITTSTGRCLHTYDLRRGLNLVFVTRPQTPATITATYAWKDRVLAAWGGGNATAASGIWIFKRGKRIASLEMPPKQNEPIRQLIIFGSWIVGCGLTCIEVWKSATYDYYTTLYPPVLGIDSSGRELSGVVCNMPTLLNKILVGRQNGSVELWNISVGKLIYTFEPPNLETGQVTALQPSPALYLLAIARADGSVVIHDIRTDKEIMRLNSKSSQSKGITCISFRTDGLGAGKDGRGDGVMATARMDDGDITLWDLHEGGRVMGVLRNGHSPSSLAQDGVRGGVSKIEFLSGQPVLVSSGRDNSLKSWIFDENKFAPIPRILHSRSGHAATVTRLNFIPVEADGADSVGKWLLSAGRDQSLWGWSLRRDGQSTELSQGDIKKKARKLDLSGKSLDLESNGVLEDLKAAEITAMACCLNRDGGMGTSSGGGPVWANVARQRTSKSSSDTPVSGWESVITGHRGDKFARTWFWGRKKAGRWAFETGDGTEVKTVTITPCGTFALIGSAGGSIDMFNLQSGLHRQRFPASLTPAQARKLRLQMAESQNGELSSVETVTTFSPGDGKHSKDVTGVAVDGLNQTVISCGLDGKIKFWDFSAGALRHQLDWSSYTAITASRYHQASDLIAFSCDDLLIRVVDIETRKLVRELWGCVGQIRDFCFSNDGRWIVAASMDSVIRVWDLPTGHLIDAFRVDATCTALTFSTTGQFLATAHSNSVGINIWTNRSLFTHVPTRHIQTDDISEATLPTASGEGGQSLLDAAFEEGPSDDDSDMDGAPPALDQLSEDMTTLSLVPRSRVQTLVHLDTIASRNKPQEPPKKPEKSPFFLPSIDSKQTATAGASSESNDLTVTAAERSRISALRRRAADRPFTSLLQAALLDNDAFVAHLKSLPPSVADVEIRSLDALAWPNELGIFVRALTTRLRQRRDYEVIQAWMAVFLKAHADLAGQDEDVARALREWKEVQEKEAKRLGSLAGYCSGVVAFLRSSR